MKLTQRLLSYLNRVFSKDPVRYLALRIQCDSGEMTWMVCDGVLTLTPVGGTAQALTLQLSGFTVQALAQYIASQAGYEVPYQDTSAKAQLSALTLLDASGNIAQSNGDHLYAYTSLLYSYVNANASELELAQSQIPNMLDQMSTTTAGGEFLDLQGSIYDVPRESSGSTQEQDTSYSPRIISEVLLPSSNNIGMALALEARYPGTSASVVDADESTGVGILYDGSATFNGEYLYDANVTTATGGLFDVTFAFDFSTSSLTYTEYAPVIVAAVNGYRLAGTYIRNLILKNGATASVQIATFEIGSIVVTVFDQ